MSLALAFVLGPAAVVRARRGRWGLAVGVIAACAMGLAVMMTLALGPTGLYGPAREASYPNVLLVTISGLRWDHVAGPAGDGRVTPTLTALGARGAMFRTAVSTSTAVGPAAASILTSLYPASHGLRGSGERLRPGVEGLPLALAALPDANRGAQVALAAPGVDVLAAAPEGQYTVTSGTSIAAAQVSGVAALLLARKSDMSPAALRQVLVRSGRGVPGGKPRETGAGVIDALDAVNAVGR